MTNHGYTDIIVPVDGSDDSFASLAPAAALARGFGAKINLVAAWGDMRKETMRDQIDSRLGALAGVDYEVSLRRFDRPVAYMLTDAVATSAIPLVCMTTHGRGRSAALRGSVAAEVLERVACPVVLIGPDCLVGSDLSRGPALVCTDGSAFADSIIPVVDDFARALDLSTEVVTVIDQRDVATAMQAVGVEGAGAISESAHVRTLSNDLAVLTDTPSTYAVLHGNHPARSILDRARQDKPALIAMATHDEYRLRRVLHSSVTADVARHAECPVLTFRPDDEFSHR